MQRLVSDKDRADFLAHSGRLGMKWGVRNGPPYPLDRSQWSAAEKRAAREERRPGGAGGETSESSRKKSRRPSGGGTASSGGSGKSRKRATSEAPHKKSGSQKPSGGSAKAQNSSGVTPETKKTYERELKTAVEAAAEKVRKATGDRADGEIDNRTLVTIAGDLSRGDDDREKVFSKISKPLVKQLVKDYGEMELGTSLKPHFDRVEAKHAYVKYLQALAQTNTPVPTAKALQKDFARRYPDAARLSTAKSLAELELDQEPQRRAALDKADAVAKTYSEGLVKDKNSLEAKVLSKALSMYAYEEAEMIAHDAAEEIHEQFWAQERELNAQADSLTKELLGNYRKRR